MVERRKQTKESAAEQLSSSQIFTELCSSLDLIFLHARYNSHSFIGEANFFLFAHIIDVFSFAVRCFRFFDLVHGVFRGPCLLFSLIELHLIRKMLGSQNNNADQLRSQFVTSVWVIPAKVVSVDCMHVIGLSIKRETLTSGENLKLPVLHQYLFSFNFFSETRDYLSTMA